jgi:hypothetical protein
MVAGGDLFFAQSDNRSSEEVVFRLRVLEMRPGGLVIQTENVSAVRLLLLTLFGPGDIQVAYFLAAPFAGRMGLLQPDVHESAVRRPRGHLEEPGFSDRSRPDRGEVLVEDGDLTGCVVGRWLLTPFG